MLLDMVMLRYWITYFVPICILANLGQVQHAWESEWNDTMNGTESDSISFFADESHITE